MVTETERHLEDIATELEQIKGILKNYCEENRVIHLTERERGGLPHPSSILI